MALTKQIEIGGLQDHGSYYIGLFDSKGNAYSFSSRRVSSIDADTTSQGILTASLSLGGISAGSVTISYVQDHNVSTFGLNEKSHTYGDWLNSMLYVYVFVPITNVPLPWSIMLTFSNAIDIGDISIFQADAEARMTDLEIKKIDENQMNYTSTVYTKAQQLLDYPSEVKQEWKNPSFTPPVIPLDRSGTLPKIIKVINKDGRIYIKQRG